MLVAARASVPYAVCAKHFAAKSPITRTFLKIYQMN